MKKLNRLRKHIATAGILLLLFVSVNAQNLSFTRPTQFLRDVKSDKAPAIVNFKGDYFIAWKQIGSGGLSFSYLGKHYDTAAAFSPTLVPGAQTSFAPAFRVLNDKLYLFWIAKEGGLKYTVSKDGNNFNLADIHEVNFTNATPLSQGITAAAVGDKILIATHADNKDNILYSELQPGEDGVFKETTIQPIGKEKSKNYPFVVSLDKVLARYCWQGKGDLIYYADYDTDNKTWSKTMVKGPAQTQISPAIHHVWDTDKLFYIWRGYKNDTRLYYKTAKDKESPAGKTALPIYFNSNFPVSICKVDENNFLMAYTGNDNLLYISNFSSYDPANWMEQYLHPVTSKKTLQDIVFPGSHDAGMSVLTATGGQQKGTINECNTLTQKLNIEQQLNGGIRMFDLRAGTFNKLLYAKHCASDCMEDAIGGGYGESLRNAATGMRKFLLKNKQEIIVLSFSHFCERETPLAGLKDSLLKWIGTELVFAAEHPSIGLVPLSQLAGKVVISFETTDHPDSKFPSCSIADQSAAFINFRRAYAATNDINKLLAKEKAFFFSLNNNVKQNDIVRLDWQITQSSDEAPVICNDFEDEKLSPLINGAMLLANVIKKNKSIIDHSLEGNKYLPIKLTEWMNDGTISRKNKPNILYVDAAGPWITDFCIDLLKSELYR
jgi:hypothetical protein